MTLLVKANRIKADPIAALTLLEAVNRMYETDIDTSDLRNEKDQIGQDFEELSLKYAQSREETSGMYM